IIIASYYTDDRGRSPYHIGIKGQTITPDFGWGVRKGAPYRDIIQEVMNRMLESGITNHWMKAIKNSRIRQNRRDATPEQQIWRQLEILESQTILGDENQTVLRMKHVMGVFLILLIGNAVAFLIFLREKFIHK
ncbi:hypothetical protein SK128_009482, partial [Halocaridina rubra]